MRSRSSSSSSAASIGLLGARHGRRAAREKESRVRDFAGRVAVVTGAAGGIGRALALEAARGGMRVALADVDEAGLEETRRQAVALGAQALARRTDVSREADVAALADAAERELGGTHLVFNNAGV